MEEAEVAYGILEGRPEGRGPLVIPRHIEYNIEMDF